VSHRVNSSAARRTPFRRSSTHGIGQRGCTRCTHQWVPTGWSQISTAVGWLAVNRGCQHCTDSSDSTASDSLTAVGDDHVDCTFIAAEVTDGQASAVVTVRSTSTACWMSLTPLSAVDRSRPPQVSNMHSVDETSQRVRQCGREADRPDPAWAARQRVADPRAPQQIRSHGLALALASRDMNER
jgi:hypothetical protein